MAANPSNAEPSPQRGAPETAAAVRSLPFAFAKRHGVLIKDARDGVVHAIYRTGATTASLAEARRYAGVPLIFAEVDAPTFDASLQAAYESGAAMTMVEGLDDETDLNSVAQQLPEPSDLIDSDEIGRAHV